MKLTLYVPGDTWLHRLDPVTKLGMTGVAVILTFVLIGVQGGAALLASLLLILGTGDVLRRAAPLFVGLALVACTFLVVQGLVHPDNVHEGLRLGPLTLYREGLLVGVKLTLRLYNMLSASLILVLATHPSHLTESLVRRGLPPRAGYVVMAMLQMIPAMIGAAAAITDAQRSRAMETEGGLWTRARAFIPLMGPLVTSSLIATEERALALEVRGFGSRARPTFLRDEDVPPHAAAVRGLTLCALIVGIAARLQWGM